MDDVPLSCVPGAASGALPMERFHIGYAPRPGATAVAAVGYPRPSVQLAACAVVPPWHDV
jgi:hypothetical protein